MAFRIPVGATYWTEGRHESVVGLILHLVEVCGLDDPVEGIHGGSDMMEVRFDHEVQEAVFRTGAPMGYLFPPED